MAAEMNSEELKTIMMEIVKAVEEADVPDDLRVAAFEKTFDALIAPRVGMNEPAARRSAPPEEAGAVPVGPSLEGVSARLGLDSDLVSEIYYVDDETLGLALAASKLDTRKAVGTQQIALLIAAGRQAGGWEEWTPINRIREVARDYGRFDAPNFASTIRRMGNVFSFRGKGRQLDVRLTRPGYEQAADLARELGGV